MSVALYPPYLYRPRARTPHVIIASHNMCTGSGRSAAQDGDGQEDPRTEPLRRVQGPPRPLPDAPDGTISDE
jgi:hypothetical protein